MGISLKAEDGRVILSIEDDGAGFDPHHASRLQSHWGLATMRERAEAIDSRFHIDSGTGKGTRIVVEVAMDGT